MVRLRLYKMFPNLRSEASLKSKVSFSGIGVHSGLPVSMTIFPAPERAGIIFKRIDVTGKDQIIKLSPDSVLDPTLCTRLVNKDGISVAVIEHLMAAFKISGITNAIIEIDSLEVPIMDGSAIEFVKAFKKAGITKQSAFVPAIVIKEPIEVKSKNGIVSIFPNDSLKISIKLSYDRIDPVVKSNNNFSFSFDDNLLGVAKARTFGWFEDYEKVLAMGLGRGTSEENTIVILKDNSIKNKGGLRHPKELVMHKCLDLIGDIAIIGFDIVGRIEGLNISHSLNNLLMRKLLNEISNHEIIDGQQISFEKVLKFA